MNISSNNGLFEAEVTAGLLSVRRANLPLFTCRTSAQPWFVVHSDGLYAQNAHDALTPLYRGEDAGELLRCITGVLTEHASEAEKKRTLKSQVMTWGLPAGMLLLSIMLLVRAPAVPFAGDVTSPDGHARLLQDPSLQPALRPSAVHLAPASPVPEVTPAVPENRPAAQPADGWSLPLSAREGLPARLQKAASRELFTVPLSSGHARTLYVFADPDCPNCQRMERHFETAAGLVNVVIFPVTIEGGDASLRALTPVMALDESVRATAWKQLFAADAGISVPGGQPAPVVTDETLAETARGAIGVNEVAFRAYRLPGTPWTISDDGRYVPQAVLSSPAALMAFLNGERHDGQ